jgi:hypothetical protein
MNRLLACCVFLAGSVVAPCQNTFIVQFDSAQSGYYGTACSVFETEEGYVVFTQTKSRDGLARGRCGKYTLDTHGLFLGRSEFDNGQDFDSNYGFFSPVARAVDSGFVAAVSHFSSDHHSIWVYHFDPEGDSASANLVLTYPPEDSVWLGARHLRLTSDGGEIIGGWHYSFNIGWADGLLIKLNSADSIEWISLISGPERNYEVLGVAEYYDHGFLAVGQRSMSYVMNDCFLIRTDSLGNQLWRREFGWNADSGGAVRVTADSSIIVFCDYRDPAWPILGQQVMVTKLSGDGQTIWQKRSHMAYPAYASDFEVLPDHSFIAVAIQGFRCGLMKFNSEGDSLWTRYLHPFTMGSTDDPYDVEPTSDGGFVITGDAFQGGMDPHPNLQTIWVAKTDSLGCVVPGCQNVGVQEYVMDLQNLLRVSPNPASEMMSLSLELPEGGEVQGQAQVQLLDATGKMVLQERVEQNFNQLRATLDVSALPTGTYYLHLRDDKRWLAGSKVVVEQ